jgi:transposase-like protein
MTEHRDPEKIVREIKRKSRRKFSAEEKVRIVLEGLRDHRRALSPRRHQSQPL